MTYEIEIRHLFISGGHRFVGRHGKIPQEFEMAEKEKIECVGGKGIVGDRFFDYKEDYKGQLTLFSEEVYLDLIERFNVKDRGPSVFRRNVVLAGVELNSLIGQEFRLGDVDMKGTEEATPCYWMNQAFCVGANEALRGRGGLRVRILSDGELSQGGHTLVVRD
jgi:MOSC domain-containing protein YiiM